VIVAAILTRHDCTSNDKLYDNWHGGTVTVTAKFRLTAYVEAATYLMLLAGVIILHGFGGPDFVKIMGPIHGVVFLVYFVLVLNIRQSQGWKFWKTILVLVASAIPLGGFFVGRDLVDDPTFASH
jgi:integral membrane protein